MALEPRSDSIPPHQESINSVTPRAKSNQEGGQPPINPPLGSDIQPAPEHKKPAKECRPDQTPIGKYILEVLAAGILAAYTVAAFQQLEAIKGQLEVMQGTLEETTRAGQQATDQTWRAIGNLNWLARSMDWSQKQAQQAMETSDRRSREALNASIAASRLDERAWVSTENTFVDQFDSKKLFKGRIQIFNRGKTPARRVQFITAYMLSPTFIDGPSPDQVKATDVFEGQGIIGPQGGQILVADGTSRGRIKSINPTLRQASEIYDQIRGNTFFFYVFGRIKYYDISDRMHVTKYCFFLHDISDSDPPNWQLGSCNAYNEMD
jgi:hypothetical protein